MWIGNLIKNNLFNLKKIGQVVLPFVRKKLKTFLNKNKRKKIVLLDIPLYLENKMNKRGDVIIFLKTKRKDVNKRFLTSVRNDELIVIIP